VGACRSYEQRTLTQQKSNINQAFMEGLTGYSFNVLDLTPEIRFVQSYLHPK
jgi:hypothetical protein